ncbi:plasma membrane ATPase 1-like [Pyrus ussuriensis x Pyrus communis]|uniref:Plasma membrane ATPase 1-like n=1 Tax=Pyrus ussuriensis x Pyrus communis TaxID=2448454 RepID=A0A5N5IAL3_9ROSA|nr:plasma membrane ATPase 1-like [Pyrus ussuriensis x Pyrus communis]
MTVNIDPFLSATVGIVDAHLPKNKGKGKAEFVPIQYVPKQNSWPPLKLDLFSNEPPTELSRSAIVESMSDSSAEEIDRLMVLCSYCKTRIVLTKPKEKLAQVLTPRQPSTTVVTPPKSLEYMQEFHKKHSANDLYELPKACQEAIDLALTCPDQVPDEVKDDQVENTPKHDTTLDNPEDDDQDPMASKDDKLKADIDVLFPYSSSVNLQHLKPLYVTVHIESFPIFKIFIDCWVTINIMPISVMKALRRT